LLTFLIRHYKMAFSYSGITNYGKVGLPSVESWGTNMNILKDPPKSVHTRKIDKVGQTSAMLTAVDESGDRFCEAINYYPRGQNPMVSVSYGQGQQSSGEAFLPYRIARDGAFRPPIWRQEDLLPLSRLPRIWTEVSTQPYKPIFTKRIRNCGTVENTREVKNDTLQVSCASSKIISAYPNINQPDMKPGIIRDPLAPGQVSAPMSSDANAISEIIQRMDRKPILMGVRETLVHGQATTQKSCGANAVAEIIQRMDRKPISVGVKEVLPQGQVTAQKSCGANAISEIIQRDRKPISVGVREVLAQGQVTAQKSCGANATSEIIQRNERLPILLAPSRPIASGGTNPTSIKEQPIVAYNVKLSQNHPNTSANTNFAAPSLSGYDSFHNPQSVPYTRLPPRIQRGGFDGHQNIPSINMEHPIQNLIRVR
jgi:hypothetical protein